MSDVFLNPGQWFVGDRGVRVHTLLGSCVSITLWHPQLMLGAMSHCLLPTRSAGRSDAADTPDARYVDEALALMTSELGMRGVPVTDCEAKVFGGGDMFQQQGQSINVGRRNGEAARGLLQGAGIALRSESLFGAGHRKIVFDIGSGDVWVHQALPAAGPAP